MPRRKTLNICARTKQMRRRRSLLLLPSSLLLNTSTFIEFFLLSVVVMEVKRVVNFHERLKKIAKIFPCRVSIDTLNRINDNIIVIFYWVLN